jgi:uncharacterized protein GlcG (DUF336 family)
MCYTKAAWQCAAREDSSMEKTYNKRSVTAELAAKMVDAAMTKAKAIGAPQVVAILDESGLLKAFCRMDGTPLISIEVAQNKAYTALLGAPSQDFYNRIKDNPGLLASAPHIPRIVTFGGGLPIRIDGVVAGAIGVSGGSVEQDIECAQAGLDAIDKA